MVYVNILSVAPVVYIPLNGWEGSASGLAISVKNTVDGNEVQLTTSSISTVGFMACVTLAGVNGLYTGEWEYSMVDALGASVASGLLVAFNGNYEPAVQYESDNNVIQYGG